MSDDRPKKSWREIDQMRSRGGGSRRDGYDRGHERATKTAAYSQYKAHLDKLFKPGGGTALPAEMREKLGPPSAASQAKTELTSALRAKPTAETLRAYLDGGLDLPDDPRFLMDLLDVDDAELLQPVLQSLLDIVESGKRPSRMLLLQKLDAVILRHDGSEAAELAQLVRGALG